MGWAYRRRRPTGRVPIPSWGQEVWFIEPDPKGGSRLSYWLTSAHIATRAGRPLAALSREFATRLQRPSNSKNHSIGGCTGVRSTGRIQSNTRTPDGSPLQRTPSGVLLVDTRRSSSLIYRGSTSYGTNPAPRYSRRAGSFPTVTARVTSSSPSNAQRLQPSGEP
jgi:hypothetical protein